VDFPRPHQVRRYDGLVKAWIADRGFGFIRCDETYEKY